VHNAGANTLVGNQYTYNDANNINSWINASGNHTYGYDLVDRLTSATNSAQPNENYSYDSVGNRTSSNLSGSYSYQPFNKLISSVNASYIYDNNGNMLSKSDFSGITTFTWNEENQLTQVALPTGLTVNYKYDGLGRRIQRTTTAGTSERYVYDGQDVLLDLNADWSVATTYLNDLGIDNKLRQTNTIIGVSYYLIDHLRSNAALTDANGSIVEQLSYDSFGNSGGSGRTRYDYTGRERDPNSGLMFYRARWFDPQVGRFISEDPIGFGGGMDWYDYVGGNPLRWVDPTGLDDADREWENRINPSSPAPNPWYWSHNESADNPPLAAPRNCGCGPNQSSSLLMAGAVAAAGRPNPATLIVGALLITYAIVSVPPIANCPPDNVIPFPRATSQPTPAAAPIPPPPPQNPDDNCDEQWRRAFEICESSRVRDNRGVTGGHTDLLQCARGLVSQRCGGNRVEY
jgi:RHS repeat-associated protein